MYMRAFAIGITGAATVLLLGCSPDAAATKPMTNAGAPAAVGGKSGGGASGAPSSVGALAGSSAANGGSGAGAPVNKGADAAGQSGDVAGRSAPNAGAGGSRRGGRGAAGMSAAGRGGAGAPSAAGSGGATAGAAGSGCTQNLSCQLTAAASSGDPKQDCVDRINQFRTQCACLPALARWNDGEACADMMAMYDSGGTEAHAGFKAMICKGGNAENECPGWRSDDQVVSGCLQQMWNEGPPPTQPCDDACFQMYGHFINMTNTKLKQVACGFYTTSDNKVWSVQNFSP
jgi:hypothetical protein